MHARWIGWSSVAMLLFVGRGLMAADDSAGPAGDIPDLKPLDHFRGEWTVFVKTPDGSEVEGRAISKWILDGTFLQTDWSSGDGKIMILRGYDKTAKKYRMWWFAAHDSEGGSVQSGDWDEASKTLITSGSSSDGASAVGTIVKFVDDDTEEWTVTIKLPRDLTPIEIKGTNKRQKK